LSPNHEVHCYVDRRFTGKEYPNVHKSLDWPVFVLGRGHRVLYHDYITAMVLARKNYPFDPNVEIIPVLHIDFDEICSADPEYRKVLEKKAREASKQRKKLKSYFAQFDKMIKEYQKQRKNKKKKFKIELDKLIAPKRPKKRRRKRKSSEFSFKF